MRQSIGVKQVGHRHGYGGTSQVLCNLFVNSFPNNFLNFNFDMWALISGNNTLKSYFKTL